MKRYMLVLTCIAALCFIGGCDGVSHPTETLPLNARQLEENPASPSDDTENSDILLHPYKHYEIVAVGDSITYGIGALWTDGYPEILETTLRASGYDVTVHNKGVPGAYSYEVDSIFTSLIADADIALIMIGANDALCLTCNPQASIRSMLQKSRNMGVTPLVSTVTPKQTSGDLNWANPIVNSINAQILALSQEYQVELVDNHAAILQNGGDVLFADAHHFTDQGYEVIAREWFNTLLHVLAPPR